MHRERGGGTEKEESESGKQREKTWREEREKEDSPQSKGNDENFQHLTEEMQRKKESKQTIITPIFLLLDPQQTNKQTNKALVEFEIRSRSQDRILYILNTKNTQESHHMNKTSQNFRNQRTRTDFKLPRGTRPISCEAISEGNEAWSEIP
ncbi:unnamed protein product [Urochloa humidicola]